MAAVTWNWEFNRNRLLPDVTASAAGTPINDQFWQRLLKAVPVQAVGFITAADSLGNAASKDSLTLALGFVFIVGLLIAYLEMKFQRNASSLEIAVAIVAYFVWVYAQGGVFAALGWYYPIPAGLIALAFAGLVPFVPKAAA